MIVPKYWAEAKAVDRKHGKQITARRFGWSDVGQDDAQRNAESRANEALAKLVSGQKLDRSERKIPYNGAQGVPIREEIIAAHGDTIITRNSYGALCLNTPNVLFADIDFAARDRTQLAFSVGCFLILGAIVAGTARSSVALAIGLTGCALILSSPIAATLQRLLKARQGDPEANAVGRIALFINAHPSWHLRIYKTPAGLRALALHRTYDTSDPEVAEFFKAVGTDPLYAKMCANQHCFRARVSPKPWRMGIRGHIKPRPGTWPVSPDRLAERTRWVESYERGAANYASCKFIEAVGTGATDAEADKVRALHDEMSRAMQDLPIA